MKCVKCEKDSLENKKHCEACGMQMILKNAKLCKISGIISSLITIITIIVFAFNIRTEDGIIFLLSFIPLILMIVMLVGGVMVLLSIKVMLSKFRTRDAIKKLIIGWLLWTAINPITIIFLLGITIG